MRVVFIFVCIIVVATVMMPCAPLTPIATLPSVSAASPIPDPQTPIPVLLTVVSTTHLPRAALPAHA